MIPRPRSAVVYGSCAGQGGLGHCASTAITAMARRGGRVVALGPGFQEPWSLPGGIPPVERVDAPRLAESWFKRHIAARWRPGDLVFQRNRKLGIWACGEVERLAPESAYLLTEVALETLRWSRREGIPSALDNPNGHIRNFRAVYEREFERWCTGRYDGHPTPAMMERVEEEYHLAERIRVYAPWGRESMIQYGVPPEKAQIVRQAINLDRFRPPDARPGTEGPLRLCFVGSLDLRKGFIYLLRAIKAVGAHWFHLEIAGSTGDRHMRRLFEAERKGISVSWGARDPIPVYHRAEVFALPTLEDGLPFVLPEAMACGLPCLVTDQAGAGECVQTDRSGWRVPAGQIEPLAAALEAALKRRHELPEMGRMARRHVEEYAGPARIQELADWFYAAVPA